MTDILITNTRLVNEGASSEADILIRDGRIERVDRAISAGANIDVYDAGGNYLLPGLIDDQVHFREPGGTHKGSIATESAAALAGGITSFMEMPNVNPPTVTRELLHEKYLLAEQKSRANYAFYLGATNDNIDQIRSLLPGEACGVKVFMGASTGNMLVDKAATLEEIFSSSPVPVVTHCEDTPTILANEQREREQYGENVPMQHHPLIRSTEACYLSSSLAVDLAHRHQTRLHVLHLTTARELDLLTNLAIDQKHITAEVCVHHLFFDDSDYELKKGLIKCNPAIKTSDDRHALIEGVRDNLIDVIATDHAPHTWEEKQQPYFQIPSGLPLVQHALLSVLEHYHKGLLSLELIAQKTAHAPAIIFGVVDRGFVREGYWADLVLVDVNKPYTVTKDNVLFKCGWSPFEGYSFKSSVIATWINGTLAYHHGRIVDGIRGQRLNIDNHEPR